MKKLLENLLKYLRSSAIGSFFAREISPSRWVRRVLLSAVVILAVTAALVSLLDPCFHYHKWEFIPRIYTQPYWQIPGILKTFEYDSVIIGSSTSQNFNLADFRRELGVKPVKATASACYSHTGRTFAETAIRFNPKLKRIYYGLDLFIFFKPSDYDKYPLPDFLYTRNHYRDLCYWWNYDIIFIFLQDIQRDFGSLLRGDGKSTNPDIMFAGSYFSDMKKHGRQYVVKSVRKNTFRQTAQVGQEKRKKALQRFSENLDNNFVPMVKNNPSIEFIFYFTPSSGLNFSDAKNFGTLDLFLTLREMIAEKLLVFPNVRIYDFQVIPETLSVDNYKDLAHYKPSINTEMVKWIREDKYRVRSPADMAKNNQTLTRHADELMPLWKDILAEAEAKPAGGKK